MADTTLSMAAPTLLPNWLDAMISGLRKHAELERATAQLQAMPDHMLNDVGVTRDQVTQQLTPLSQDAATALHLMSLGQWY